jgi:type I restriction enzyme S subunit
VTWQYSPLGDLVDIKGGGTPTRTVESYWNGGIPWATVKDFKSDVILTTEENISELGVEKSATNIIPKGIIIIPTRMALGKVAIAGTDLAINQDLKALVLKNKKNITTEFLFWFLRSSADDFERAGKGATVKGITIDFLKSVQVPLPPLATQKHIARVLEQADQLRKQAQQMESELNRLAQSLFLERFGEGSAKSSWKRVPLISVAVNADDVKCGPFGTQLGKSEFTTAGVPLWGIKHVNSNFELETDEFVSEAKAKDLNAYSLMPDDIVMTRKGTVGNCHLYPEDFVPGIMHSDLLRIRVDTDKVAPLFLVTLLRLSKDVERQIDLISHGAIMAGINVTKLKQIEIDLPPLSMQQRYCVKLEAIQEELIKVKQIKDEHEALFGVLMHRAFKGELTVPGSKAA